MEAAGWAVRAIPSERPMVLTVQWTAMLLIDLAALQTAAASPPAPTSIQLDAWCDNSIRVRVRGNENARNSGGGAATMYTNAARGDSVLCLSAACVHSEVTSGYTRGDVYGYAVEGSAPSLATVSLAVYYNHATTDNLVGLADGLGSFGGRVQGYQKVFLDGRIFKGPSATTAKTAPLFLYFNNKTRHSITTTASPPPGYATLQLLGYLCEDPGCTATGPSPPQSPLPVLDGLPGALRRDCFANASPPPPPILGAGELRHGNLIATVSMDANSSYTVSFARASDGANLTVATPKFGDSTRDVGYYEYGLQLSSPADGSTSRVFGLGQIEGTSAHGGCDGNGSTAKALPLARNGLEISLSASKFHIGIPWAFSADSGYGVLLNSPGDGTVSISSAGAMEWQLTSQLQLDFWITTTKSEPISTLTEKRPSRVSLPSTSDQSNSVYLHYADAVGHAPPLPNYAAMFWQCRLRYRTSRIAQDIAAGYQQRNLSLGVLVIDFMNQKTDGDFRMNPQCYETGPAIANWVQNISQLGGGHTRTMLSFWPDIQKDADAASALSEKGCISGSIVPGGHVQSGTIDPTSQNCRDFIWSRFVQPNYVAHGIRDFWLDEDDMHSMAPKLNSTGGVAGSLKRAPAAAFGRIWANRWMQTFSDGLRAQGHQGMILTRSFWAGAARLGVVLWSSDIFSTFDELRAQVPEGVAASLSGVPWWTTDVGGFGCPMSPFNNSDPYMQELIVRWYQFGVVSPIFRTHGCRAGQAEVLPDDSPCMHAEHMKPQGPQGSCGPNEIWSYGSKIEPILTSIVRFRNDVLAPYILELGRNVSERGVPTLRPLWWEFPNDKGAANPEYEGQFMLGPLYMAAPVTRKGVLTWSVYFPGDSNVRWKEVVAMGGSADVVHAGGQLKVITAPLNKLPLYERL